MQEDNGSRVSSEESTVSTNNASSQSRQRKKRKWDQPAESLVAACTAAPGFLPLGNMASLGGISIPGLAAGYAPHLINPLGVSCASIPQVTQAPTVTQSTAGPVPKLKIQEELIAREIVINDAESSIRYKLTKRQTQEEIQKCTGAVVITRGKFCLPNAPPDGEKPLYLHISAEAHLKEMAEKILAVDQAAAMVEEILKQSQSSQPTSSSFLAMGDGIKVGQALSVCVFLGFNADPSFNIAARIRGPNDQYINHIMNETGVSVSLRGRDSGNIEGAHGEGGQPPLHLFLSSNNPSKLEDAQCLAENLMDTISIECGALRVSSCKVYTAVPPPQQVYDAAIPKTVYSAVPPPQHLLDGVHVSGSQLNTNSASGLISSAVGSTLAPPVSLVIPGVNPVLSHGPMPHGGLLNSQPSQTNVVNYPQPVISVGTNYNGYGGIYPQATPLQQVALALRQSSSTITSVVSPPMSAPSMPKSSASSHAAEKPPKRRKFQELPSGLKDPAKIHQDSEVSKLRNVSTMPAPKKAVQSSNVMPPPPPRNMPPPPSKFTSPPQKFTALEKKTLSKAPKPDTIPDTLVKLMEYGEDDDQEETEEEPLHWNSNKGSMQKPFWAL